MDYTLELVQDYFWLQSGLIAELKELSEVFSKLVLASAYS
jgi:hypothetical protein